MRAALKLVIVVTAFLGSQVFAKNEELNLCADWKVVKPKVQSLQRMVACSSSFSSQECKENLGYAAMGAVGLAGASVGAMAGRNIQIKPSQVCSLVGYRMFFFESVAWASCNQQVKDGAASVAQALRESNAVREAELGNYLTEKLAQENPSLDRVSSEMVHVFQKDQGSLLTNRLKEMNEKLKPFGVTVDKLGHCSSGTTEACDKLWSLFYKNNRIETRSSVAINTYRLKDYYPNDPKVMAFKNNSDATRDLLNRVQKGLVNDEAGLEKLFTKAVSLSHETTKGLFANSANFISRTIPSLAQTKAFREAAALSKVSAEFIAKNAKYLKKILPFGLAGALGIATGANATEIGESFLPPGAGATSVGCGGMYSKYAPLDPDSESCKAMAEMTPEMIDFLNLPENLQQSEVCNYGSLKTTIERMSDKYFPADMALSCAGDSVNVVSRFRATAFSAQFNFQGNNLASTKVSTPLDGVGDYNFDFDPKTGTIIGGKLHPVQAPSRAPSQKYYTIEKGMPLDALGSSAQDFAARQVVGYMGRDCCMKGSGDSCSVFKTKSASGSSPQTPILGTSATGTK